VHRSGINRWEQHGESLLWRDLEGGAIRIFVYQAPAGWMSAVVSKGPGWKAKKPDTHGYHPQGKFKGCLSADKNEKDRSHKKTPLKDKGYDNRAG